MNPPEARVLLLSNRLTDGDRNLNPLADAIWRPSRADSTIIAADASTGLDPQTPNLPSDLPWPARMKIGSRFGNQVELVAADFPPEAARPGTLPLTLVFKVGAQVPRDLRVFVHLDGAGLPRIIGDHDPVGGLLNTRNWEPGTFVRDTYNIPLSKVTTSKGTYRVYVGFWPGGAGARVPIVSGPADKHQRVPLGSVVIR